MSDPSLPAPKHFNFSQIEFIKSAPSLALCPPDSGIEVAFVGRSNAGKSSALNTITNKNRLARTSKTPGRTQLINFFQIDLQRRLVDLPGYGYAKIPVRLQSQLGEMLSDYLSNRRCLYGLMMMMDIRHPMMPADQALIDFAQEFKLPIHILLTKCDKFNRGPSNNALLATRKAVSLYPNITVQTFSSLRRIGIEEVHQKLDDWFNFDESNAPSRFLS